MNKSPMQFMKKFHEVSPNRIDVYKKMQKAYLADKVGFGFFTNSTVTMESDTKLKKLRDAGFFDYFNPKDFHEFTHDEQVRRMNAMGLLAATRLFGAWRNTASVYKIDESISTQALESPIPLETPSDIYLNLPEWAVYFELPKNAELAVTVNHLISEHSAEKITSKNYDILGFWATHDNVSYEGKILPALDIFWHLDIPENELLDIHNFQVAPFRMILSPDLSVLDSCIACYGVNGTLQNENVIRKVLSLLLWLCVEEPDVTNIKGVKMSRKDLKLPRYARSKQTGAFVPPMQETHLEIASRMGGEIREWSKQIEEKNSSLPKRKAPHIRRGHWSAVWIGSGSAKTLKVYWQKPLFINAK